MLTASEAVELVGWFAIGGVGGFIAVKVIEKVAVLRNQKAPRKSIAEALAVRSDSIHSTTPELMVKLVPAVNGRLLEVSTKTPHSHAPGHWEWEHEMFIVEEGQTLSQAIAMVMTMKGLEK